MPATDPRLPDTIRCFAPAKINLTLHVTGQRADGYHLLDSLVMFADVGDQLHLTPGPRLALQVTGPFAAGVPTDERNLVWQAAELAGWRGRIDLEKHLPHGGGIGGGSADAGAVLRALNWSQSAVSLGADVPVCHYGQAAWMSGIGDQVTPAANVPAFHAVLVNPRRPVGTPAVFERLARKDNAPMQPAPQGSEATDWIAWLRAQRNDLGAAAQAVAPVIAEVLKALDQTEAVLLTRMSGSGATCFGLYPTEAAAQAAARVLSDTHPDWWSVATVLR
ncbi:4-(cytidine 5'-diphospho)-2-C-methyl-D-erythritol kinase [Roseobacter sp. A03A-229]